MSKKEDKNKYIFIDTNIYRSIFSESETFSDEVFDLLRKLTEKAGIKLILPQQVIDEVKRNSICNWFKEANSSIDSKIKNLENKTANLKLNFPNYEKQVSKISSGVEKEKKALLKQIEKNKIQFFSSTSLSNKKLKKIFDLSEKILENEQILQDAYFRREKGNPPRDKEKLGDKIIWESILYFLSERKVEKPTLIFVANDISAWKSEYSDKIEFDNWLQNEYKHKTGGKVILVRNLSDIPELTKKEQEKIKIEEAEEKDRNTRMALKTIVPEKLRESNSFAISERIMRAVEHRLEYIEYEAIDAIIKASLENSNMGTYNQVIDSNHGFAFFNRLLDYSISKSFDLSIWKNFYLSLDEKNQERYFMIRKKLESSGIYFSIDEIKHITIEDIPF